MTNIEWTDETWNPIRGCSRVSAGCDHCYAIRQAHRQNHPGGAYEGLTKIRTRMDWSGVVRLVPEKLDEPLKWRKPRRVFVNSMSDLFHESLPFLDIDDVFETMAEADRHTYQVLTKRPERMLEFCQWRNQRWGRPPLANVWLGISVEDQRTADERIPLLLQTPAAVRFVSYEPALGPVDFGPTWMDRDRYGANCIDGGATIDWIIVGGESGPGARPCDVAWIRSVVQQCKAAGVPCFVKQVGSRPVVQHPMQVGALVDAPCADRKGGDPSEWPEDLRVREFPR